MSTEIAKQAAQWVVRRDRGLTAEEAQALAAWRAADTRHEGALVRALAMNIRLDRVQALGDQYDPAIFAAAAPPQPRRARAIPAAATRRAMLWGGGAAVAAGLAGAGAVLLPARFGKRYMAPRGEVKLIALADGSRMTLNSASAIEVRYSRDARDLKLISGEALFDVAKNRARPFVVDAGDVKVRAVGTSFSVRRLVGKPTEVVVREGVVEITRVAPHQTLTRDPTPILVAANERAIAALDGGVTAEPLSPPEVQARLAWKDGMIAFKHTTLVEAAQEFARYSDTAVVIDDPVLAGERITGLYAAADPVGFAEAAAVGLDLKVRIDESGVHLYR